MSETLASAPQQITVLGATGSIGLSTLDVIARHPDRFRVFALSARHRIDELAALCRIHRPRFAVVDSADDGRRLGDLVRGLPCPPEILLGQAGLEQIAAHEEVDQVMAAIVGAAGLAPTLAAARAGKRILLANKESLVLAGRVFMDAVRASGALLLPIDSEHNALFQCMPPGYVAGQPAPGIRRLLLTASGGPFRTRDPATLGSVTPDQACAHPNWSMGRKISVDSATMMNKGLELIEACWLFDVTPDDIEIVVHPESVIHSLVEYLDGSVLAQLGQPDMRTPIAQGLAWPERVDAGVPSLDLVARAALNFEAPDPARFPCLRLAADAVRAGGIAPALLNAANEVAVEAFLAGRIGYLAIPAIIDAVLTVAPAGRADALEEVLEADAQGRGLAMKQLARHAV
ncbi:MAG TPA: 1-deoxy-D-xylulose-5-phosphate reductoisomerase [Pseudomonadales bacterium]|nr:1-deoxy-D-xylulose-5-phosphate reductoisomerase [Pseudomonadales bacterium]